jgi:transposase
MTTVVSRAVTGGVDTHLDVHVAAALDPVGGLLGVESFPTTPAGCRSLLAWLNGFGPLDRVGIEGTGSYGAGLARLAGAAGVAVVEVNRADRSARRRQGKSDPLDAVSAARAAQSGAATGRFKGRDGLVEAIRTLMVTKRSARRDRTATINQMRALISTGPDDIRARFAHHHTLPLVAETAALRPRPGPMVEFTTQVALQQLGRRARYLAAEIDGIDQLLAPLVAKRAPPAAGPGRGRTRHRRHLVDRRGRPPRPAPIRGGLGPPVRGGAHPGVPGQDHPPPTEPRRRPPSQPCPMADRAHPHGLRGPHPRLRAATGPRGQIQGRDHPLPQTLRRPRGLPAAPSPPRRLNTHRERPDPLAACRAPAPTFH